MSDLDDDWSRRVVLLLSQSLIISYPLTPIVYNYADYPFDHYKLIRANSNANESANQEEQERCREPRTPMSPRINKLLFLS